MYVPCTCNVYLDVTCVLCANNVMCAIIIIQIHKISPNESHFASL